MNDIMQGQNYMKNAAILTVTGIFLRAAGMAFRVYIAGRVGAQGMGLYQLIYSVYSISVTLATAGLTICATRIVTDVLSMGKSAEFAMRKILKFSIFLGCVAAVMQFFGAKAACVYILNDMRCLLSLQVLAPSLPFMAISAALRGYFIARRSVAPNARAQIAEQLVRIAIVMCIFYFAAPSTPGIACAAVFVGTTISEIVSWIYMQFSYNTDRSLQPKDTAAVKLPSITKLLLPISGNMYLSSILRTVENVMVPACLAIFTMQKDIALSQYGALKGMAMPVLFFPFSFLATLSTLLMPEITQAYVRDKQKTLVYLINKVMRITCVLSALTGCLFRCFAVQLGDALYHSAEIGMYISILGPIMPIMYLESMVDGVLKGMDEQLATFKYSVIDSVIRIALIALLLPSFGMKGFLFIMVLSNLLTGILNVQRLMRVSKIKFDFTNWLFKPLLSCAFTFCLCEFVLMPICKGFGSLGSMLICALPATGAYFLIMWLLGGFSLKDLINAKK